MEDDAKYQGDASLFDTLVEGKKSPFGCEETMVEKKKGVKKKKKKKKVMMMNLMMMKEAMDNIVE